MVGVLYLPHVSPESGVCRKHMKNKSDGWTVLFSQVTGAAFNLDSFAMINSLCLFHAHNCELGFRTSVRIFDCSLLIPLKALINE